MPRKTPKKLRIRFDEARKNAAAKALDEQMAIAVHQFQSYDIRPKAATEINDMKEVSRLLSHTEEEITKRVYMRVGAIAKPSIERKFRNAFRIISGLYP